MKYYVRQIKPYVQPPVLPGFSSEPYPIDSYEWFAEDMEEELREEIVVKDSWSTLIFKERYVSVDELYQKPIKIVYDDGWKASSVSEFEIELSKRLSPEEVKEIFGTTDIGYWILDCEEEV